MGKEGLPKRATSGQVAKPYRVTQVAAREHKIETFGPARYDYRGARYGEPLVRWLNEPSERAKETKNKKIIKDLGRQRVSTLIDALNHFDKVATILEAYTQHPVPFIDDKGAIVFGSKPADQVVVDGKIESGPQQSEHQAVTAVLDLQSKHLLDRVRQCQCGCGLWLFQKRTGKRTQIFFDDAHRKEYHARPRSE